MASSTDYPSSDLSAFVGAILVFAFYVILIIAVAVISARGGLQRPRVVDGAGQPPAARPAPHKRVEEVGAETIPLKVAARFVDTKFYVGVLIQLLFACAITFIALPSIREALKNAGSAKKYALDTVADSLNGVVFGIYVHLFVAPLVIVLKIVGKLQPYSPPSDVTPIDEAAPTPFVLYSMKLTLVQRLVLATIGALNSAVTFVIGIVAFFGLDLSIFWFPAPFIAYLEMKLKFESVRVQKRRLFFETAWHDIYLLFVFDRAMNLIRFTLWERYLSANLLPKFLESRIRWVGGPPPGYTNEFVIFTARPSFKDKVLFGLLAPLLPPVTTWYAALKIEESRLRNTRLGGGVPRIDPPISIGEMVVAHVCGPARWRATLDKHLIIDPPSATVNPASPGHA